MIENCLRHKIIRDFLKHYNEKSWKEIIPYIIQIGILNLENSFNKIFFTSDELRKVLRNLQTSQIEQDRERKKDRNHMEKENKAYYERNEQIKNSDLKDNNCKQKSFFNPTRVLKNNIKNNYGIFKANINPNIIKKLNIPKNEIFKKLKVERKNTNKLEKNYAKISYAISYDRFLEPETISKKINNTVDNKVNQINQTYSINQNILESNGKLKKKNIQEKYLKLNLNNINNLNKQKKKKDFGKKYKQICYNILKNNMCPTADNNCMNESKRNKNRNNLSNSQKKYTNKNSNFMSTLFQKINGNGVDSILCKNMNNVFNKNDIELRKAKNNIQSDFHKERFLRDDKTRSEKPLDRKNIKFYSKENNLSISKIQKKDMNELARSSYLRHVLKLDSISSFYPGRNQKDLNIIHHQEDISHHQEDINHHQEEEMNNKEKLNSPKKENKLNKEKNINSVVNQSKNIQALQVNSFSTEECRYFNIFGKDNDDISISKNEKEVSGINDTSISNEVLINHNYNMKESPKNVFKTDKSNNNSNNISSN